jgi:peroxiredoxin
VSARAFLSFLAVLAVIGLLGFGLLSKGSPKVSVGDKVPDTSLPTLDGARALRIAAYRGDWVLVTLWAAWCGPCRKEAPALERWWLERRGRGATVLGINVQDNSEDARAFAEKVGATYPQARSIGDERSEAFGSTGVPENFLVDPHGRLALIWRGPVDGRFLRENVDPLVEGARG